MTLHQTSASSTTPSAGGAEHNPGSGPCLDGAGIDVGGREGEARKPASMPVPAPMAQLITERPDELRADREWAMQIYSLFARGGDDEQMTYLIATGDPWSKSRPRFTKRGRTYQPRDDEEAEKRLQKRLRTARDEEFTGNVMLACRFYRSSFQRIDADNLLKHVCDSATGLWWRDDSQVTFVLGEIHLDREHPRTVIVAANHSSSLLRGSDLQRPCAQCGEMFTPASRPAPSAYCSARCGRNARGLPDLTQPIDCAHCGNPFRRRTSEQRFCSVTCNQDSKRGKPRGHRRVVRCTQCGAALAHYRGGRCRDCWRAHPNGQPDPVQGELEVEL